MILLKPYSVCRYMTNYSMEVGNNSYLNQSCEVELDLNSNYKIILEFIPYPLKIVTYCIITHTPSLLVLDVRWCIKKNLSASLIKDKT